MKSFHLKKKEPKREQWQNTSIYIILTFFLRKRSSKSEIQMIIDSTTRLEYFTEPNQILSIFFFFFLSKCFTLPSNFWGKCSAKNQGTRNSFTCIICYIRCTWILIHLRWHFKIWHIKEFTLFLNCHVSGFWNGLEVLGPASSRIVSFCYNV